jgi:hypothetical protein
MTRVAGAGPRRGGGGLGGGGAWFGLGSAAVMTLEASFVCCLTAAAALDLLHVLSPPCSSQC